MIRKRIIQFFTNCCVLLHVAGCKDLTGSPSLPAGTSDPSYYNTAAGAVGMHNAAVAAFEVALPGVIRNEGFLTDELVFYLHDGHETGNASPSYTEFIPDTRTIPEGQDNEGAIQGTGLAGDYEKLQGSRTLLVQAIGQLATYDTAVAAKGTAGALRGELYALEGYAEIMLADLFCSGVPLSTLVFQGDFNYRPSSTTLQVYEDAISKFDTAMVLAKDSAPILNMARIGKGRAWLDVGQYDSAATAVAMVPTDFIYRLAVQFGGFGWSLTAVADREGKTGLPFRSSGDPRTAVDSAIYIDPVVSGRDTVFFPTKYDAYLNGREGAYALFPIGDVSSQYIPYVLSSGVEARLIEAEAALRNKSSRWLILLNQLRQNSVILGTFTSVPAPLSTLIDPGESPNDSARITLLFAERAAWLFLTGERQGDLRRLVRAQSVGGYGRPQNQVYPTGPYELDPAITRLSDFFHQLPKSYGSDVNAPIPSAELVNPYYHGCLNRDA